MEAYLRLFRFHAMSALIDAEIEAIKRKSLQRKNEKSNKDKDEDISISRGDGSETRTNVDMNGKGRESHTSSISKQVDGKEYEDRSRSKV